jgi:hypothetical protein
MATLERPGVEVEQTVTPVGATVLKPTLPACIVGPCFQIVSPLTSEGVLDSTAAVITPARIVGSTVGATLAANGLKLKIVVSGGNPQIVTLPVSLSGNPLSQALIVQSINKQLTGATAAFVDDRLVITTNTSGEATSLYLAAPDSDSAYTVLGLADVDLTLFSGKSKYDNLVTEIPFNSLPATKTAISNLSIDADNLDLYRYYANTLSRLSPDSAVLHNSWSNGIIDRLNGLSINAGSYDGNYFQPLVAKRVSLAGKNTGAGKTNTVFHPGTHASLKFPLSRAVGDVANTTCWPDSSSANYLYVEAQGLQDYLQNSSAAVRKYVGKAGNAVTVTFTAGAGTTATWNDGGNALTIQLDNGGVPGDATTTTFAQLDAVLAAGITGLAAAPNIAVSLSYALGTDLVYNGAVATLVGGITFRLGGGSDPVNFAALDGAATRNIVASMVGSTKVAAATTAADLGIAGETITLSINGRRPVTVTFVSGDAVVDTIDDALVAAYGAAGTVTVNNAAVSVYARSAQLAAATPYGEQVDVLELFANPSSGSEYYAEYQESTLQVTGYSSIRVIEKLLGGALVKTSTGLTITPAANGLSADTSIGQAAYNALAQSYMEKGIQPAGQALALNNVKVLGAVVFKPDTTNAVFDWTGTGVLVTKHGSLAHTAVTTVPAGPHANYAAWVAALKTALGNATTVNGAPTDVSAKIAVEIRTINGLACLVVADMTGTSSIKVVTAGSTASLVTALTNAASNATALFDTIKTSASATINVTDTGTDGDWVVGAVSGNLAPVAFASTIGFGVTNATHLTGYLLNNSYGGGTGSYISYFNGNMNVYFVAGNSLPIAAMYSSSTYDITWTQAWPHSFGAAKHDYTGRVFTGGCVRAYVGDSLRNGSTPLGRIASIQNLTVGATTYDGAQLVLTDASVDKYASLSNWYIRAEALDTYSPARAVEPEISTNTLTSITTIKHAVNRSIAGIAAAATAPLYAGYKALRLDVSANTANPSVLAFENVAEVETILGPISLDNPLAFGLAKAFGATTDVQVYGIGVDDVTADAAEGTPESYGRSLEVLELAELYCIAPLTYNREVHKQLALHCTTLSAASGKKERAGICCTTMPVEKEATLCISGNMTLVEGALGKYTLTFTDETLSIVSALDGRLDANGDTIVATPGTTLTAAQGVYVDRAGDAYRYLVTEIISATEIQIEVDYAFDSGQGPGSAGNDDVYYKEDGANLADYPATGEMCSVYVRQAEIDVTTTTGKNQQVEAIAGFASGFAMSRFMQIQPEQFGTLVDGTEALVPGYYFCAAWAGASSQLPPAQGMTNLPIPGFTRPIGSNDKFTEKQMATAAAGGVNWIIQDVANGPVFSRHQLTTNIASLKTREWSVVKSVDFCSKTFRGAVLRYVGRYNITPKLLEEISLTLTGTCASLSGNVVAEVQVTKIQVDPDNPDHILVDIALVPFFPNNKIRIRLAI